ncbi:cell division protein FtsK [Micromonospora sp. NPDC049089]|uniref:cell division protein FtsK n=1 Tax=Micromonospora sp. NPDC049089 TaxID=3155496 RepID=UPI0033F44083
MADDDLTPRDTHFEIELDEEPDTRKPVYVDVVTKDDTRRPIIPAQWRGTANIKATVKRVGGEVTHRAGYHVVRSPWYIALATFWAIIGVLRVGGRQLRWWWDADARAEDGTHLKQVAANSGDAQEWHKTHNEVKATRLYRGLVLLAEVVLLVAAYVAVRLAPTWAVVVVAVIAVPLLAHVGRPQNRPIIQPAVVTQRYRKLNTDIVARAYHAAGLAHPDKPGQQLEFLGSMSRDPKQLGSQVMVGLPYGKTFDDAVKNKGGIASGLDVSINQVFITRDKVSHRSHMLYIADQDPLAISAGRTPLLRLKPTDIWKPAPFGLDERGNLVKLLLMWISVLVGAQPRKGKTFSARLLALFAVLDPYVVFIFADGKNSPDWSAFRLVAHMAIFGTVPNSRDRDPVNHLITALRYLKKHIEQVNDFLSKLPTSECPEGKLTRELSRKYKQLRVHMLVMEEFQVYYELDDKDASEEIASLLSFIMAVGPSAGVIILSSSQKPSGIGAGDNIKRLFTRYRDNHAVRFALKCGNREVSMAVLGGDAYGEGFDASTLPVGDEYKGVGILYGASDNTPIVRTHLADAEDAEKILRAARMFREAEDLLTGEAAGEDMAREARDVLNDVRNVFYAGKATISWPALAARLKETYPEAYADITPEAISAMVRKLGVKGKSVKDSEYFEKGVGQGCDKSSVEAAIERRAIESR